MRDLGYVLLALGALLFWPIQGTTHGWVWTALMLRAVYSDWQRARGVVHYSHRAASET